MPIRTTNPATNEVVKDFKEMTKAAVDQSVTQAVKTFAAWKKTEYAFRAEKLFKVAGLLRTKKRGELARLITLQEGREIGLTGRGRNQAQRRDFLLLCPKCRGFSGR